MATLTLPEPSSSPSRPPAWTTRCTSCSPPSPGARPGTPLAAHAGPDTWQADVLEALGTHARTSGASFRHAVASGHGVGKSALAAWIILWHLSTHPHPQIVVTANTGVQLSTKTWRELAKWLQLSVYAETFTWTATKCYHRAHPATWFAAAVPWRADRPEAFAGTHEAHVLILMDEASAIDDLIWETTEGAMTTPGAMWVAFGNPTRSSGRFKECFAGGRFAHRWQTTQVDSRDARMADQAQIAQWLTDYGEDSDFVRVRVKGLFPRQAVGQFIGEDLITAAQARQAVEDPLQPCVVGVDVARFGDDRSVVLVRQGGTIRETRVYREIDTVGLAGYVCEVADLYRADTPTLFVDAVGIGAGVVDQCRARGYAVQEVQAGASAQDPLHYANKRAEMWHRTREWLHTRGCLTESPTMRELVADLTAPEYAYDAQGRLQIETKASMKGRGLASSDLADALCHTFAEPVAPRGLPAAPMPAPVPLYHPGRGLFRGR